MQIMQACLRRVRSTKISFAGSNEDVLVANLVLHHIMTWWGVWFEIENCSSWYLTVELVSSIRYKLACVYSEDSNKSTHLHNLIRVFVYGFKKSLTLGYPKSTILRLIRLHRCAGWSESSVGAHVNLYLLLDTGSVLVDAVVVFDLIGVYCKQSLYTFM